MRERSKLRGHDIEFRNGRWVYCDTGEPTIETCQSRPCGKCGLPRTPEGHDPCLGTLPNVINACCGHGQVGEAYVQFADGSELRGVAALRFFPAGALGGGL